MFYQLIIDLKALWLSKRAYSVILLLVLGLCVSTLGCLVSILVCYFIRWSRLSPLLFLIMGLGGMIWYEGSLGSQLTYLLHQNYDITVGWHQGALSQSLLKHSMVIATQFGLIVGALLYMGLGCEFDLVKERISYWLSLGDPECHVEPDLSEPLTEHSPSGALLGHDCVRNTPVILTDKDANHHTLAVGTTGSGKTTAISNIIEMAIRNKHSVIVIDGKGDMPYAKNMQKFAQSQQVPFYLFSMTGGQLSYNPLACGGFTSKKDRIIELRNWSEPYYKKIAENYLQTVFKILEKLKVSVDLCSLALYLDPDQLKRLAKAKGIKQFDQDIVQLECNFNQVRGLFDEIIGLSHSEIGHLFDCQSGQVLRLDKALSEKAVVYFSLKPLAFPAYASTLGKLIINDLKYIISTHLDRVDNDPVYTIFDEFSVFSGEQVINLINQGRSAGICAVLSTQSLSDIERSGGQSMVGQIINNCNHFIIHRQNNPKDADIFSKIIGKEKKYHFTQSFRASEEEDHIRIRHHEQDVISPDEVKRLKVGEAIVLNKSSGSLNKVNIRQGALSC